MNIWKEHRYRFATGLHIDNVDKTLCGETPGVEVLDWVCLNAQNS